jgi:hypothetical protein
MKANELRIGNFLLKNNMVIECDSYSISSIENYENRAKEYEPILLTEGWLEKFGFYDDIEYDDYLEMKIKNDDWDRILTVKKFDNHFMVGNRFGEWVVLGQCKYIHQLQNLYFALTGKELTIK